MLTTKRMTTIIGIRTNHGLEGVVMASDHQSSKYDEGELVSKTSVKKIYCGDYWAMGDAGADDKHVLKFYKVLMGHRNCNSNEQKAKTTIERAVREKYFEEVVNLNTLVMKKDNANDIEKAHSFLFAVNKPDMGLWYVDEFGNLKEPSDDKDIDYACIGSGEKKVDEYLERAISEQDIDRDKITIGIAIDLIRGAMNAAEKDAATGFGYDLIVITDKEVRNYGDEIKKSIVNAEREKLEEIKKAYNGIE